MLVVVAAGLLLTAVCAWMIRGHHVATSREPEPTAGDRERAARSDTPVESPRAPRIIETADPREEHADANGPTRAPDIRLRATWGSGDGQLGRRLSSDGAPESPNSFAVDAQGNVLVLDQMNRRILRFGGDGSAATVAAVIDSATTRDLAVGRDGSIVLLDGNADAGTVRVLGPDGRPRGELPLRGANLASDEHATGVVIDGDDVYVERDHGPLIRLGSTSGSADGERTEIAGRPSRDGRLYLSGGITDPDQGRYWVNAVDRATNAHRFTLEFHSLLTLQRMMLLDTDRAGTVYVAVMGLTPETGEHDSHESIQLECLDPESGRIVGHATFPTSNLQEDVQRELVVLDQGGVLLTVRSADGFAVQRIGCE